MRFAEHFEFSAKGGQAADWEFNKKANALTSEGKIKKERVSVILPETFMNKSGNAAGKLVREDQRIVKANDGVIVLNALSVEAPQHVIQHNQSTVDLIG